MSSGARALTAVLVLVAAFITGFGVAGYHIGVLLSDGVLVTGWQAAFWVGGMAAAVLGLALVWGLIVWGVLTWIARGSV